jgi:DNA-binding NarL/FixJ family response regulator
LRTVDAFNTPSPLTLGDRPDLPMQTDGSTHRHTVVLADDHDGIIRNVSDLLANEFNILAAVSDGRQAIEAALKFKPEIFILDICMPGLDGIQVAREIKRLGLSAKVVLLTIQEDADYIDAARAIGASYVLKSRMHSDLFFALKEELAGRTFTSQISAR